MLALLLFSWVLVAFQAFMVAGSPTPWMIGCAVFTAGCALVSTMFYMSVD